MKIIKILLYIHFNKTHSKELKNVDYNKIIQINKILQLFVFIMLLMRVQY